MRLLNLQEQFVDIIINDIRDGVCPSGKALLSEESAMAKYGLSRKTVRNGYARLVEIGCVESRRGSGHYVKKDPLEAIKENYKFPCTRKFKLGVILFDLENYFAEIIKGIKAAATFFACEVIVRDSYGSIESEMSIIEDFIKEKVDGIILTPLRSGGVYSLTNYLYLEQLNIPFITIGKSPEKIVCDSVFCEDIHASSRAIFELAESGCRTVVHISDYDSDEIAVSERSEGYELGMMQKYPNEKTRIINFRDERFEEYITNCLNMDGKIGFTLMGTPMVKGFLEVVNRVCAKNNIQKELNKEIFIVTHGQDEIESVPKGVKYIKIPKGKLGFIAVRKMLERIERVDCLKHECTILTQEIVEVL